MRAAIVAAVLAAGMAAAPAYAGPPEPTLDIHTSVDGTPSPVPMSSGAWTVTDPGRSASLAVSGINPVAGTTKVVAMWTSHVFRPGRGTAVQAVWTVDQDGAAVGTQPGEWSIQDRARHGRSRWSAWHGPAEPFLAAGVLVTESVPGRWWVEFPQASRDSWQFQLRMSYVANTAGRHSSSIAVSTAE